MGTWPGAGRKEFWWEREWRHRDIMVLPDKFFVFCPADDMDLVKEAAEAFCAGCAASLPFLDPAWSLEQMIAHLASFDLQEIGPFPS